MPPREPRRRRPAFAEPDAAHSSLGKALWGQGPGDEAIAHFRKALEIKPDFVEARQNPAIALGQEAKTR